WEAGMSVLAFFRGTRTNRKCPHNLCALLWRSTLRASAFFFSPGGTHMKRNTQFESIIQHPDRGHKRARVQLNDLRRRHLVSLEHLESRTLLSASGTIC